MNPALESATCRSCGAPIFFVVMVSGKRMPLNQTSKKVVTIDKATGQGSVVDGYTSHFSTWAAGLFEGEGSVRINTPTKRNWGALLADMVNTDETIVRFFHDRWKGHFKKVFPLGNRREYWRWRIAALQAAEFLRAIQPFLRGAKRERVALGLEFQMQKVAGERSPEYRARQFAYYERMKRLNARGLPVGAQLRLVATAESVEPRRKP